ncbi:MAG TPA: YggT family protein [Ornithinibacter sp.]|jgi:YggT family protein|nr:YggT family protein [Ornithinibacter sp.]
MNAVRDVLGFVVFLYFLVLIGRVVFDWIRIFAKEWRPRGAALLVAEPIYTLTEPPLRALRKVIPPLRLGGVALDLSFMVLFFVVYLLLIVL